MEDIVVTFCRCTSNTNRRFVIILSLFWMEQTEWRLENRKRRHSLAYLRFMLVLCVSCVVLELILFYNLICLKSRYIVAVQYLFLAANYAEM